MNYGSSDTDPNGWNIEGPGPTTTSRCTRMIPQNDEGGSKRLHIIGANEIAAIYDIPRFSAEDQAHFFLPI